ncbi:MAG: HEAT repeat domain-containing protein [Planctomycetales bacterium]
MNVILVCLLSVVAAAGQGPDAGGDRAAAPRDAVAMWIRLLRDDDSVFRGMGARELEKLGPKAAPAVSDLISLLADEEIGERTGAIVNRSVCHFALEALVAIGPGAVPGLVAAGGTHENPRVRANALSALGSIVGRGRGVTEVEKVVETFQVGLGDSAPQVRTSAVHGLRFAGSAAKAVLPDLERLFQSDSVAMVRASALEAIIAIESDEERIAARLMSSLSDESADVQATAIDLLAARGPGARFAVAQLARLLDSKKEVSLPGGAPDVLVPLRHPIRQFAAEALGRIGEPAAEAVPALKRLMRGDPAPRVRIESAEAVARIDPEDNEPIESLSAELDAADAERHFDRNAATGALTRLGPRAAAAVPALGRAIESDDAELRTSTVEALGAVGGHAARALLGRALSDADPYVRGVAAEALKASDPARRNRLARPGRGDADGADP